MIVIAQPNPPIPKLNMEIHGQVVGLELLGCQLGQDRV